MGQRADVGQHDDDGEQDVDEREDRQYELGHFRDAAHSPEDHGRGEHREQQRAPVLVDRVRAPEDVADGVGLDHVERHTEGEDQQHCEQDPAAAGPEAGLDVVRRSATERAIGPADLVELRERGLDEPGRHPDEPHDPHPEHGPWATECESDCDSGDVAGPDAGREPHGEGLEGGDPSLGPGP